MWRRLGRIWRTMRGRAGWEAGLEAELREHLELRARDLERGGMTSAEARRQARVEFGSRERYRGEVRQAAGLQWLDDAWQDAVYAARTLRRNPGFALTAIVSTALGIGVNAVVFGVVNAALLRPLPVAGPDELWFVNRRDSSANFSYPAYRDFRDSASTVSGVAAFRYARLGMGEGAETAERYWGYLASGNYFDVLGLQPAVGRFFHAADEQGPGTSPYIVLSYNLWQRRFGGAADISGREVRVNKAPFRVLGVAPKGFEGTELTLGAEFWVPFEMQPQIEGVNNLEQRGNHNLWMMVRGKEAPAAIQAEFRAIAGELARRYPGVEEPDAITLSKPGLVGKFLRDPVEAFSLGMLLLGGLVLAAASLNLAGLLGARASDRSREMALRISIGAGRGRVIRQLLTEATVLTLVVGVAGCALGWTLLAALSRWRPPVEAYVRMAVEPDWRVMGFALTVAVVTGLAAGLAPARMAWRLGTAGALKGGAGTARNRWPFRDLVLAAQTAVCCVLVVSALVAGRGLTRVLTARPGFETKGAAVMQFDPLMAQYTIDEARVFQRRVADEVMAMPGVRAAGYANSLPLDGSQSTTGLTRVEVTNPRRQDIIEAAYYNVSPGYFAAMGTRLLAGREYEWSDPADRPIGIINETLARRLFGTAEAVGRRYRYNGGPVVEVIGVAEDGKYFTFSEAPRAAVFQRIQRSQLSATAMIVRSDGVDEGAMAATMAGLLRRMDPAVPVYRAGSLREATEFAVLPARIASIGLGVFGLLAIMLAVTGIYGLASYSVSRRVREIGIRTAIGAGPGQVLRAVGGRLVLLVAAGSALGMVLGVAAGRILASVVYQATPRDPATLGAVVAIMAAVAAGSAWGPMKRALRIAPMDALRQD